MRLTGGKVFDLEKGFVTRDLCTDGDRISTRDGGGVTADLSGYSIIPGLVDVHFHGCVGEDFSDATPEGLQRMADYELSQGVTHICPAGMTLPEEQLTAICRNAAAHRGKNSGGAELVGIHLEGPFLSMKKRGAQNADFLHRPDVEMLRRLQKAAEGCVRLVTVAPEEPGGLDFVKAAVQAGIRVSVGHSTAGYDMAKAAFDMGADHATHLFNGMPPYHHRDPGVIGAAADDEKVMAELICDGIHIHPSVVRGTFRLFGRERVVIISDSLRATGMPDGRYPFGGQEIEVSGSRATIAGHPETLAGSVTSLFGCLRKAVEFGIPPADAVRACSYNPAKSIGLEDRLGTLDEGREANFLVVNDKFDLKCVVFRGKIVQGTL